MREARIVDHVGPVQHAAAKARPFGLGLNRDDELRVPSPGCIGAVGRDRRVVEAERFGSRPVYSRWISGTAIQSAIQSNSETDMLAAFAGALAGVERLQDRGVSVHAAADVGDGDADAPGESGPPVIEARPVSHWMRKS